MKARTLALLLVLPVSPGCTSPPETKVVQGTAIEHGEALFHDASIAKNSLNTYSCATCHETTPGEAARVSLTGAPLAGALKRPSYWGGQELELLPAINDCLYYFMLKTTPWTAEDEEARAGYAYLESLPSDGDVVKAAPFTVVYQLSDTPNGNPKAGEAVYNRACASCHGAAHTGVGRLVPRAPPLPEQTLAEHPLAKYTMLERRLVFVEKIRHGGFAGYAGQMPPFSKEVLSDEDIGNLFGFFGLP